MTEFNTEAVTKKLTEALQSTEEKEDYVVVYSTDLVDVGVAYSVSISESGELERNTKLALHNKTNDEYSYMFDWYEPLINMEQFSIANTETSLSEETLSEIVAYFRQEFIAWTVDELIH